MFDSSAATGSDAPPAADQHANTVGWVPPPKVERAPEQVVTVHAPSTPGPNAAERNTDSNTTEQMLAQRRAEARAALPRLPPVPGYDVLEFVGRGGMGLVYRAVHHTTGRTVALKLINPSGSEDPITRERFDREVRTLAALKHPNIVPVYDAGEWHGFPYCAMEFARGGTLSAHLDRVRADLRGAAQLMAKVSRAVGAMHAAGVLHRDIKPLNVLLDASDQPMVADFGLARHVDGDSDLTYTGHPVGTRLYMAPEQTLGRRTAYTTACDIWALGVTLYEVLTGQRPFTDDGVTEIYHRIRFDDPPPCPPEVPPELEAVVRKCLAKNPEERYPTADAIADDLENWLAGRAVTAPLVPAAPVAVPAQFVVAPEPVKTPRRTRVLLGAGALLLLAGFAAAGFLGAFRDRVPPPAPKALAERVAGGEKVKLTDETGLPTGDWATTDGHKVTMRLDKGYHWFTANSPGMAALADENWGVPVRVEADVAVTWDTSRLAQGGLYVGRRTWAGLPIKHDSLVWFGISPRHERDQKPTHQFAGMSELVWWERDQGGSVIKIGREMRAAWDPDGNLKGHRFVRVVIEVRADELKGWIDGQPLAPVTAKQLSDELKGRSALRNPALPKFEFAAPVGTGVGVMCRNCDCAVVNLTISKLDR